MLFFYFRVQQIKRLGTASVYDLSFSNGVLILCALSLPARGGDGGKQDDFFL